MSIQRERLLALIEYVQQWARMRTKVVSNVADHGRILLFEQQVSSVDGVRLDGTGQDGDDEIWLAVPRPPNPELPPEADSAWLAPWLAVGIALLEAPKLAGVIEGSALIAAGTHRDASQPVSTVAEMASPAVDPRERVKLCDYAFRSEIERRFQDYLERAWKPWAEAERRRRRLARLYMQLYTLQQELSGSFGHGQLELAWGIGIGVWKGPGEAVSYPLVTRLVDLTINATNGAAEIRPRDVRPKLELEYYASIDHPGVLHAERRAKDFFAQAAGTVSPFDRASYEPLLRLVSTCLQPPPDDLLPGDLSLAPPAPRLEVEDTWVLYARPRSAHVLIRDFDHLAEAIRSKSADAGFPEAVAALVSEPGTNPQAAALPVFRGLSATRDRTPAAPSEAVRDLYFPKPFNDEQVRIVQLLEAHDGVVVQGPPGTGKTHTIANIICHWLATGRRVLVTSMKDPALAVLREKLPEPVRPLAISLLSSEQEGLKQFEQSIQRIAGEVQSIDPAATAREIAQLEETIDGLHARIGRIDTDIGRWARLNLSHVELEGEHLNLLDAAREVVTHAGEFEWIPDPLGVGPQFAPRFGDGDIARLREARRRLGRDIDHLGVNLPPLAQLPDARQLLQAHGDLCRFVRLSEQTRSGEVPALDETSPESLALARDAAAEIERVQSLRNRIPAASRDWAKRLKRRLASGGLSAESDLLSALGDEMKEALAARQAFLARPVHVSAPAEAGAQFTQAVGNLAAGRRAFGLAGWFGRTDARKALDTVAVNGQRAADIADWQHVAEYIRLQGKWRELAARWNAVAPALELDPVAADPGEGGVEAAAQFDLYRTIQALNGAESRLVQYATTLFPAWPQAREVASDSVALDALEKALMHHLTRYRLAEVWADKERLHQALEGKSGRVVAEMRRFVADLLGNPKVEATEVLSSWSALMAELGRVRGLAADLATVSEVTQRIEESGAPRYASLLREPVAGAVDRLLPEDWQRAWRLRRLATHLEAIDSQEELKTLAALRGELEHDLARAYRNLVVRRAWLSLAEGATPGVRPALQAYLGAVQRLGKGTGKRAARYREDARQAAAQAISAVPCWIMPHHRVSESLPAQLGCFDLVVIDEASQSDLSALPALLRARKVLIVGDDKQVAPDGIGLEEERLKVLMQRFLADQVPLYRAQLSPERSIYDLARVVFARSGVMLKEHFRCAPPIIEYSKREFYHHELRPLRLPKPSERLAPPLVDVLVQDGQRKGDVNVAEINFVVEEIHRLVRDPGMRGRSIGVISLLGDDQAAKIWDRLAEELGPEVLQRHRVACGDARNFQGQERDVMLLSMVVAPNDVGAPLTRDIFAQRFNVAASRARDRMYLVRSVGLEHLSEADRLRRSLILHFREPFLGEEPRASDLRERCESPFERELYDWLVQRGYRVMPQVNAGAHRIDLVVEGANDARLAIECDGDKHQGVRSWAEDMRRQRVLERAGWTFWRCFASTYARRREEVVEALVSALSALDITPTGAQRSALNAYSGTRRVGELEEA